MVWARLLSGFGELHCWVDGELHKRKDSISASPLGKEIESGTFRRGNDCPEKHPLYMNLSVCLFLTRWLPKRFEKTTKWIKEHSQVNECLLTLGEQINKAAEWLRTSLGMSPRLLLRQVMSVSVSKRKVLRGDETTRVWFLGDHNGGSASFYQNSIMNWYLINDSDSQK